jgi:hypothetical protein
MPAPFTHQPRLALSPEGEATIKVSGQVAEVLNTRGNANQAWTAAKLWALAALALDTQVEKW